MKIQPHIRIFLLIGFLLLALSSYSQDKITNEKKLKAEAEAAFNKGDYITATPLYSQLVSLYPKNFEYNYKFGVCLLFTDPEPELSIPYLKYAANDPNGNKMVDLYLGRAYQLNYKFDNAIRHYQIYKSNAKPEDVKRNEVDRRIEMCRNGKKLMSYVRDIYVTQRRVINEKWFFRSYEIPDSLGKVLIKSPEFATDLDKKKEKGDENSTMFISPDKSYIIFSSYGQDDKNGKDLYMVRRTANGWSAPENLGPVINSPYDEEYPFVVENKNGRTIYFASKGHNSIGGYDLYRSRWNEDTKTWSTPENLEFAINTPFDDVLIIPDQNEENAYFCSKRDNTPGMITLYKIRIDVRRSTGQNLAINENADESQIQQELDLIKKKAKLEVNATEEMIAKERQAQLAADVMNSSQNPDNKVDNIIVETGKVYTAEKAMKKVDDWPYFEIDGTYKIQDIILAAKAEASKLEREAEDAQYKANRAINIGSEKSIRIAKKEKELEGKEKLLNNPNYAKEKAAIQAEIVELKKDIEDYRSERDVAYATGQKLWELANVKKREAEAAREFADELEKSSNAKKPEDAIAILEKYIERLNKAKEEDEARRLAANNPQTYNRYAVIIEDAQARRAAAENLRNEATVAKAQADAYRAQAEATNDKQKKAEFLKKAEQEEEKYLNLLADATAKDKEAENIIAQANDVLIGKTTEVAYNDNSAKTDNITNDRKTNNTENIANAQIENIDKGNVAEKRNETADNVSFNNSANTFSNPTTSVPSGRVEPNYNVKEINPRQLSPEELTSVSKKNIEVAEKRTEELKTEAAVSQYLTNKKIETAKQLLNEATLLDKQAENSDNAAQLKKQSDELKLQAKQLLAEATIAKVIEETKSKENKELKNNISKAKELDNAVQTNAATNKNKAADKLQEQINVLAQTPSMVNDNSALTKRLNDIANENVKISLVIEENITKLNNEIKDLTLKADKLREQADKTDDDKKAEKLLADADKLEMQIEAKTIKADSLKALAKQFIANANALRNQTLVNKVLNEANTLAYQPAAVKVSTPANAAAEQNLRQEITQLTIQANDLREKADNTVNIEEREKLLAQAREIDEKADRKTEELNRLMKNNAGTVAINVENIVEEAEDTDYDKVNKDLSSLNNYFTTQAPSLNLTDDVIAKNNNSPQLSLSNVVAQKNNVPVAFADNTSNNTKPANRKTPENVEKTTVVDNNKTNQPIANNNLTSDNNKSENTNIAANNTADNVNENPATYTEINTTEPDANKTVAANITNTANENKANITNAIDENSAIDNNKPKLNETTVKNETNNTQPTNKANANTVNQPLAENKTTINQPNNNRIEVGNNTTQPPTVNNNPGNITNRTNENNIQPTVANNKPDITTANTYAPSNQRNNENRSGTVFYEEDVPRTKEEKFNYTAKKINAIKPADIENTNNQQLLAAQQLEEDAQEYFNDAIASKAAAEKESDPEKKKELLADAEDYMKIALLKQEDAYEIYRKHKEGSSLAKVEAKTESPTFPNKTIETEVAAPAIPSSDAETNFAVAQNNRINKSLSEINATRQEINQLRSTAAKMNNKEEREKYLLKAQQLEEKVKKQEIETYSTAQEPNARVFNDNRNELRNYNYPATNQELSLARLLAEEAEVFFEKAKKVREKASKETIHSQQTAYLKEATEYELIAISKQQEAMSILSRYPEAKKGAEIYAETTQPANNNPAIPNATTQPINNTATPNITIVNPNANNTATANRATESPIKENKTETTPPIKENQPDNLIAFNNQNVDTDNRRYNFPASRQAVEQLTIAGAIVYASNTATTKANTNITIAKVNDKDINRKPETNNVVANNYTPPVNTNTAANNRTEKTETQPVKNFIEAKNATPATPIEMVTFTESTFSTVNFDRHANANKQAADLVVKNTVYQGLVYKVQISALRDPSTQYHFIGIDPISTETTENGFTRYMAGVFNDLREASGAKNKIISLGFKGAFVVAYLNGRRISLDEAARLLNSGQASVSTQVPSIPVLRNYADPADLALANNAAVENNTPVIPGSKDISKVGGTVYSVQVGVFSKAVTKGPLLNFDNLYYSRTPNGLIKYYYGTYNTQAEAVKAKNYAVAQGITDAFVVTFQGGIRTGVMLPGNNTIQPDNNRTTQPVNYTPPVNNVPAKVITPEGETAINPNANVKKDFGNVELDASRDITRKSGLIYTVQIGLFSQPVSLDRFENLSDITYHKLNNGFYRYMSGVFKTYEEAEKAKNAILEIVPDAFITAYFNGERISINEAEKFKNR